MCVCVCVFIRCIVTVLAPIVGMLPSVCMRYVSIYREKERERAKEMIKSLYACCRVICLCLRVVCVRVRFN